MIQSFWYVMNWLKLFEWNTLNLSHSERVNEIQTFRGMTETVQVQGNGHPHKKEKKTLNHWRKQPGEKKNQISLISIRYFTNTKTQMCGKHDRL